MRLQPPTPSTPPAFRAAGLAATATTFVALVAMSASMSASTLSRGAPAEARPGWGESLVVRVVAAAVAVAARDLVGLEQGAAPLGLCPPTRGGDAPSGVCLLTPIAFWAMPAMLGERRLDLPPPTG